MSIAEKRERCRDLQAQLAAVKGEAPNPSEVTGALASELENLATLYATLIERLPVLTPLIQSVLVRQLNVDDVIQHASTQANQIEEMNFRSVPFAKETMSFMNKVASSARVAEQWVQYDVSERLAKDFLGNSVVTNPPFMVLLELYGKRREDVDAMLAEARRRYELKQQLNQAQQTLDAPMAACIDPTLGTPTDQTYQALVDHLSSILEQVAPNMASLDQSAAALAAEASDVKTLLSYYCECMRLSADTAAAAARLGPEWMPVDPLAALASMDSLKGFIVGAKFRDLLQKQDEIVPALFVLREAHAKVAALHHDILATFPRLRLLPTCDVEAFIGASAATGGEGNPLLNGVVLQTCFCGWKALVYSNGSDGRSYVTAIVGHSGETLHLLRPVLCAREVRADVCLSKVHLAAQEAIYAELELGAKHAHSVVIGAATFDLTKLQHMTCQSALTTLRILWTSLAEGAFTKSTNGSGGAIQQQELVLSPQRFQREIGSSPSAHPVSEYGNLPPSSSSSLVNQSLSSASQARPYMTSTSRPASGATQRVATLTKLSASSVVAALEPRPGSASPNIFKKPRENEPTATTGAAKKSTAASASSKKGISGSNKDLVVEQPPTAARKNSGALQLKSDEDADLAGLLSMDSLMPTVAPPLTTCPTRDRVLSSHFASRDVVPLLWTILRQIVDAKAMHRPSRGWWFDRLSELVYPLICAYDERVQRLAAGDAAWHREPRAYFSRGKASFELGPLVIDHEHEFYGHMHVAFVFTPLVHEACCKVATGFCMERPTCILGDSDSALGSVPLGASPVAGAAHIACALGAMSGQFVSILQCTSGATIKDLESFLAAQAFFPALTVVRDLHQLTPVVQAQLSRFRGRQCGNGPDPAQCSKAGRLVYVAGDEPTGLHPSMQQVTRFCFVNLADDLGFSLQVWLASHGFPPADIATMAQRLAVLSSMLWSVCSVRIPLDAIRRSVGAAGKALLRDGVSVTADSALFHAVHVELTPLIPSQHNGFFELIGRGLFAADANTTFFPQVVEAAYACIEEEGLDAAADAILQRTIALYDAASRAAVARSVVRLVGPSKCGKSTLLRMLQRVFLRLLPNQNDKAPVLYELQATENDSVLQPLLGKWLADAAACPKQPIWVRIQGILTVQMRTMITDALSSATDPAAVAPVVPVFFVESESIHASTAINWPRCLTVQVTSDPTPATWLSAVRHMVSALGRQCTGGGAAIVDTATAAAIVDVFLQHFEDALTFSFAARREGAAVIPFSRMAHNTIGLFQAMMELHAERRGTGNISDTASLDAGALPNPLAPQCVERVFWFACTWGCASDRSRCGWNAFVLARLSPDAAMFTNSPTEPSSPSSALVPSRCGLDPVDLAWVPWVDLASLIPDMTCSAPACRVMWPTANIVAACFVAHLYRRHGHRRIGICGPPSSGKTVLAMALLPPDARVLPMERTTVPRRLEVHGNVGTILDGCIRTEACATLVGNTLACCDGDRMVVFVTQRAELVATQCPCVYTEMDLEEADEEQGDGTQDAAAIASQTSNHLLPKQSWMLDMFYNKHGSMSALVAAIPKLANTLNKVPLLSFAAPSLWSSARHVIKMMEGGLGSDRYGAMLLQHWLQTCDSQAQVEALSNAFADVFGVGGPTHAPEIFIRDHETGNLSAVPEDQAVVWMKDAVASTTILSMTSTRRIAAMYFALSAAHAGLMVVAPTDVYGNGMIGNVSDELSAVSALLHAETARLPASRGAIPSALQAAPAADSIFIVDAMHVYDMDDVLVLEQAVLRGVRVVVLAVHAGCHAPMYRRLAQTVAPKCHKVVVRATLDDVVSIASLSMSDKSTARSVAEMVFACASCPSLVTAMSTRAFHDGVVHFDNDRLDMERDLNDKVHRASDVVKFLRRVELAVAGKAAMSVAEQQFEVLGEETSNRALEGRIDFHQVPAKSVRLIAQFTINFDDARLQDVSGPSVFFGTTREDVVAIPAVNGGTCRARCDGKGLLITTGILDFQLQPVSLQPLALQGTVTDPAAGHSVVGKVRLEQVIEGENVYNKKWLRYGQDTFHSDDRALMKPEELPSDELLRMSRMEAERYVSRVGSMAKALQGQLELLVLQNVYRDSCEVPKYLAGRTLLPLLLQLSLEERDAVVDQARQGALAVESPIGLKGLAALLRTNMYELELWLVEERRCGLPYGCLAEQNACGLRYYLECARRNAEAAEVGDASEAQRPIVVVDDDPPMSRWVEGYCTRMQTPFLRADHPQHSLGSEDAQPQEIPPVQLVKTVTPADKAALHVLATKHTTRSLTSLYQMTIARPAPGSTTESAVVATLSAAVKAQQTLDTALVELLEVLHIQFEVSQAEASVVAAIIEIGKDKIPNLIEAIRNTKDHLSAADAYVDRGGNRWKSTMENALPHAKRVAVLHMATLAILPTLSPSYVFTRGFAQAVVRDALSVSGKSVVELATRKFCAAVVPMLRLEHRLPFCTCLGALVLQDTAQSPLHDAMRLLREANPREHIIRERQLKLDAVAAFDAYKNTPTQQQSTSGTKAAKSSAAAQQQQQQKKELKDFLSPLIKPAYTFLTYSTWVQLLALSSALPALANLPANMQPSDVALKGGVLKQDRWLEWVQAPTLMTIPLYEKDPMVTMLDRLALVHVMRPERTYAAALQFVAETLGNEIPDPMAFEGLGAILGGMAAAPPIVIVYRSAHPVRLTDAMQSAVVLRMQQGKSKRGGGGGGSSNLKSVCTLHVDERSFGADLCKAVAQDAWVLVEGLELCADADAVRSVIATLEDAVAQWPDYSGMLVVPCPVRPPLSQAAEADVYHTADGTDVTHYDPFAVMLSETSWPRVACSEPNTVKARMQRFYEQLGARAVPRTASNSHRVTFLLNFLVSAISQRCRYEQVAFSEPLKLASIDADVNAAALYLNKEIPSHSAKHWDALRSVARDVVGAAMRDPRDKAVVLAFIDWLIHPEVATQEHLGFLHLPPSAALTAHVDAVAQLASYDAAEHLGLHANEERRALEREGRVLMATLCAAVRTEGPSSQSVALAAEALSLQLPAIWSAGEVLAVRSAMHGNACALAHVLGTEVDALQHVVIQLHMDVQAAAALDAVACRRLAPLVHRSTPPSWLALTHGEAATQGPHRAEALPVWLESLRRRNHQLVVWAKEGLPRVVALGALASPAGFMHAFVFDACCEASLDVTQHRALLSVVPPAQAQVLPDLHSSNGAPMATAGLYIVGAMLEGATLSPAGSIQDPPDLVGEWWRELVAPIPLLHLTLAKQPNGGDASTMTGSLMLGRGAGLSRVQEAISFSRANATMTRQRPSSAAGGSAAALLRPPTSGGGGGATPTDQTRSASATLVFPSTGGNGSSNVPSPSDESLSVGRSPVGHSTFIFSAPLYCSCQRQLDAYLCDVPIMSRCEHNYWMIRGVAIICEP